MKFFIKTYSQSFQKKGGIHRLWVTYAKHAHHLQGRQSQTRIFWHAIEMGIVTVTAVM